MDDSFAYRTTVPFRRRLDLRLVKLGVALALVLVSIGLFANWVIASERRSLMRGSSPVAAEEPAVPAPDPVVPEPGATDADAVEAVRLAVDAARAALASDGTFLAVTPARLEALQPGFTYVDGPSTTASVVSVASTEDAWAAAVLGPDGGCFWGWVPGGDTVARAAGDECTGAAALASLAAR